MNVLFLTIGGFGNASDSGIYSDLMREFKDNGHSVYVVCQQDANEKTTTLNQEVKGINVLKVKVSNLTQSSMIKKGISTILVKFKYKNAIKKYFKNVKFDLVMQSTPPVTLGSVLKYIKKRDNAVSYLLLKDIFPQNAVDINVLKKSGIKGLVYLYFRHKEKQLYKWADYIGCMSNANVEYVLKNNKFLDKNKVEVCPNSITPINRAFSRREKDVIRKEYGIPLDKKVFVYGGNLGRPQDIPFVIQCLRTQKDNNDVFFVIVGGGTDYYKMENFCEQEKQDNVLLLKYLPKDKYDDMISACDVGLIFLDYRFTIPNFPSRLLGYMQAKLPIFAVTDTASDIGKVITENNFGFWCPSNNCELFNEKIMEIISSDLELKGNNAWNYLIENYTVKHSYEIIVEKTKK